jgi:hypothetical protein
MKKGYDKAKAHEYYMKHRKLKGKKRKVKPKVTGGKISARKHKKKLRAALPKNTALQFKNKGGHTTKVTADEYAHISAKLATIKEKAAKLSPAQKTALKGALKNIKMYKKMRGK